jgi:hypothetical protein
VTAPELLNLTILRQLTQLEGRLPGFLSSQLATIDEQWPKYIQSIQDLINCDQITSTRDVLHKMKGHTGMIGLKLLSERLESIELAAWNGSFPTDWSLTLTELTEIKTRSLDAARSLNGSSQIIN